MSQQYDHNDYNKKSENLLNINKVLKLSQNKILYKKTEYSLPDRFCLLCIILHIKIFCDSLNTIKDYNQEKAIIKSIKDKDFLIY